MNCLKDMNYDIIFLQDTHLTETKLSSFNSLWKGKAYHSCHTYNSRGTSILISSNLQHDLVNEFTDNNGNYKIIECKIGIETYVLGSIYGPNRDEPQFYEHLAEILDSVDYDHVILGGDFNLVMDTQNDCFGYVRENNVNAKKKLTSTCNKHNLIDIWRHHKPNEQQFTWYSSTFSKGARLDMFLVSSHLSSLCNNLQITPGYRTDHNMISMGLQLGESRGPGLWKFNDSLLKDEEYLKIVNECIFRTIEEYALPPYSRDFLSNTHNYKDIQFQIDDGLFYETLLMMIRGETVQYSKRRAKRIKEKEKQLLSHIYNAHRTFEQTKSEESNSLLQRYKQELQEVRKPYIDGLIVRSRTRWHEEGEKASKFFLGLEKRNAMRKTVTVLKDGEQKITRNSSILKTFTNNLSKKYNKVDAMPQLVSKYISENITNTLSSNERSLLDEPLSFQELTEALQKMKKGKSPGSNGYTSCFFKCFWNQIGPFMFRAFVFSSNLGKTILSHREGIITMIPKLGKSPDDIKGWRPITLLNVDFKIISAAISARLQSVIEKLIDPCQTAYIKGRYIGESTRLVYDIINNLLVNDGSGLIMSADFEAAFDSLSWRFVSEALKQYNFGPHLRKIIDLLYLNTGNFSRIMLNGYLGDKIWLKCGIRQGDPASGYIFNLAVNTLAQQIKRSQLLTGIQLSPYNEVRISQYADDTVLFLKNSRACIHGALQELKIFSEVSGLGLNIEKTSCLEIGFSNQEHSEHNHGIKWVSDMKILGIHFTNSSNNITRANLEPKILQIEKEIAQWRRRNLTSIGRITVIKSLLISKLVHLFTALPNPSYSELKKIERLLFSFLWGSKRDPVKRALVCQDYTHGGLGMVDVQAFVSSLKLTWLKRLTKTNAEWIKVIATELPNINTMLCYGSSKLQKISAEIKNPFWKDVIEAFASFSRTHNPGIPYILSESIWFSDYTKFRTSIIKQWYQKGLRFLADLFNEDTGQIHTKQTLQDKYEIRMTFLCYSSLIRSLPSTVNSITATKEHGPIMPLRMNLVINSIKFSRIAYNTFVESKQREISRANVRIREKWLKDIGVFEEHSLIDIIKATASTRVRVFHYKLVNRILSTNKYLKLISVEADDSCTFCARESETLVHMYWHCPKVQDYINSIKTDILEQYHIDLCISPKIWFFPVNLRAMETCIISLAKMVIFEARLKKTPPNIAHLINKIRWEVEVEHNIARLSNEQKLFENKWGPIKDIHIQTD